jgi:hypothetical protein
MSLNTSHTHAWLSHLTISFYEPTNACLHGQNITSICSLPTPHTAMFNTRGSFNGDELVLVYSEPYILLKSPWEKNKRVVIQARTKPC